MAKRTPATNRTDTETAAIVENRLTTSIVDRRTVVGPVAVTPAAAGPETTDSFRDRTAVAVADPAGADEPAPSTTAADEGWAAPRVSGAGPSSPLDRAARVLERSTTTSPISPPNHMAANTAWTMSAGMLNHRSGEATA